MKYKNILLVDIGNTSVCVGIACRKRVSLISRVATAACSPGSVLKAIERAARGNQLTGSVLCSVVPRLNRLWISEMEKAVCHKPLTVGHHLNLGLRVRYPMPATIGHDRLANVCGAVQRWGAPVLVADFGTASTFDVVDVKGSFIGGVIAPGIRLMADCMADRTALLPRIRIDCKCPAIGRSTEQAMQIGTVIGYQGLVRGIVEHLVTRNGLGHIKLVATGGLAGLVLKDLDMPFTVDPSLTLRGLYRIYELNSKVS